MSARRTYGLEDGNGVFGQQQRLDMGQDKRQQAQQPHGLQGQSYRKTLVTFKKMPVPAWSPPHR